MWLLVLGLVLFLGIHLSRVVTPTLRQSTIERMGENFWKGIYSVVSLVSLTMIVFGYDTAFENASQIYETPQWSRTLTHMLMPIAFVLVVASNFPAGRIKMMLKHPMLFGVIIWAIVHLLANGDSASLVLFGSFLVYGVVTLWSSFNRPFMKPEEILVWPDLVSLAVGLVLTVVFILWAHEWLFGVTPV